MKYKFLIICIFTLLIVFNIKALNAQDEFKDINDCTKGECSGNAGSFKQRDLICTDFVGCINLGINIFFLICIVLSIYIVIKAGIDLIRSGDDSKALANAAAKIKWALIGLIALLLSWQLIGVVYNTISGTETDPSTLIRTGK